jgi:hypothetical protein
MMRGFHIFCSAALSSALAFAQQHPSNQRPDMTPVAQHVYSPYWTIGYGHESVMHLHNNLIDEPLGVTVTLLSPAGARTALPAIQIGPLGNASIDLRRALSDLGVTGLYRGSAVIEYMAPHGGALLVETSVKEPAKTLIYTVIASEKGAASKQLSAVYWFPPGEDAEVYAALQNTSSNTVHVSAVLDTGTSQIPIGALTLGPNESAVLEGEVPAQRISSDERRPRFGGVILTHDAPDDTLIHSGWIEMEGNGYSNMMTFNDPARHRGTSLYGSQIFVGARNDIFTSGRAARVDSHLVLRNTSDVAVRPRAELAFEVNGLMNTRTVGIGVIGPHETRAVEIGGPSVPTDASTAALTVTYDGPEGALMGRVFGVADDVTYGVYTTLDTYTPAAVSELYWTTEGDANTLLTVTNFGSEPDSVKVQVTYNGGQLELDPISLAPLQSATVRVGELQAQGRLAATFGGFRISGNSIRSSKLQVKEHVVSEAGRTAAPFYGGMPYVVYYYLTMDHTAVDLGATAKVWAVLHWSDGSESYDWEVDSQNTSVATTSWPTQNPDFSLTVTGQGVGSTILDSWSSFVPLDAWGWYVGQLYAQIAFQVGPVAVTCTPNPVTRGSSITCQVGGAVPGRISRWHFSGGGAEIDGPSATNTWSGTIVAAGTVTVTFTAGSAQVSTGISVNARTNFAFTAVSPQQQAVNYNCGGTILSLSDEPTGGGDDAIGKFCLVQAYSFTVATVNGGPNNGISYVVSVSNSNPSGATSYNWALNQHLSNQSGAFWTAQCGNWNGTTGFISGANLRNNTIRHEASTVSQSHWINYKTSQDSSLNLGTTAEAMTSAASQQQLIDDVTRALNNNINSILQGAQIEPLGVNYSSTGTFQGFVNFFPYTSCN